MQLLQHILLMYEKHRLKHWCLCKDLFQFIDIFYISHYYIIYCKILSIDIIDKVVYIAKVVICGRPIRCKDNLITCYSCLRPHLDNTFYFILLYKIKLCVEFSCTEHYLMIP